MSLSKLLHKKLQFFTGKGGVGKSTVVAAVAMLAAKNGLRTLIVEIDTASAMKRIFQVPFVGFVAMEVIDDIWVINIDPQEALAEYIEQNIKIKRIAKKISENQILQYFFKAAPAVNEFVAINKIWNLFNQKSNGIQTYDLILVDLPATGHAISFLNLPGSISEIIGTGLIRKLIGKYEDMLSDPDSTALNFVTLAEQMPVTETIELFNEAKKRLNVSLGWLFINSTQADIFDKSETELMDQLEKMGSDISSLNTAIQLGKQTILKQNQTKSLIKRLHNSINMEFIKLPKVLVSKFDVKALNILADAIPVSLAKETT